MKRQVALTVLALFSICNVFAHALWIETNPSGKKGVKQEVKIYYGEYSENAPEKISDWYSDVKEFELWLIQPGKEKIKLETTPGENYFSSSFVPDEDGQYLLVISHDAKDLGGKTKYQFNASASVKVGKAAPATTAVNSNPFTFSVEQPVKNKPSTIKASFKNNPSEKFQATVFSPSGWNKEIKGTDGAAQFVPEWKGTYMIEISRKDEEKGEHHGKPFEAVWRCATNLVEVQ